MVAVRRHVHNGVACSRKDIPCDICWMIQRYMAPSQESVEYLEEHADELSDLEEEADSAALAAEGNSSDSGSGSAPAARQSGTGPLPV